MRILFLGIVFLVGIRSVFGGIPVEHLNPSWLVFNDSYKTYVPYIPSGESPKVLYYSLKPVKFEYDTLQFMSDNGLCVYYNYRLIYQNT